MFILLKVRNFNFQRTKSNPKKCQDGQELFVDPRRYMGFEFQTLRVLSSTPTHFSGESPPLLDVWLSINHLNVSKGNFWMCVIIPATYAWEEGGLPWKNKQGWWTIPGRVRLTLMCYVYMIIIFFRVWHHDFGFFSGRKKNPRKFLENFEKWYLN